jgi:hypothetical protein
MLVLPIVLCISATAQVSWVSFAKSQLRVIAATSAFEASQPDTDRSSVLEGARASALQRLNISPTSMLEAQNGLTRIELKLDSWSFSSASQVFAPAIEVSGYAVIENG